MALQQEIYSFWHSFTDCFWWHLLCIQVQLIQQRVSCLEWQMVTHCGWWFFALWRRKRLKVRQACICDNLWQFLFKQGHGTSSTLWEWIGQQNVVIFEPSHSCCCYWQKIEQRDWFRLEIPVDYFFHRDNRVIKWFKKSIEKLDKCTDVKVEKAMKTLLAKTVYLLKIVFLKIVFSTKRVRCTCPLYKG